jgi:hypothetical protein
VVLMPRGRRPPLLTTPWCHVAGESAGSSRHDISVRRLQGTTWRFRAFYTTFRVHISTQLGMTDYAQLSLFSPMLQRRQVPPAQQQPISYWADAGTGARGARGGRAKRASHEGAFESGREWPAPALPTSAAATGAERERAQFKRTKAKIGSVGSLVTRPD